MFFRAFFFSGLCYFSQNGLKIFRGCFFVGAIEIFRWIEILPQGNHKKQFKLSIFRAILHY